MSHGPLKATDRRRQSRKGKRVEQPGDDDSTGGASPLADLFNDRRNPNGKAKRAIK